MVCLHGIWARRTFAHPFQKDDVELAELIYNPKSSERENNSVGITDLVVPTVPKNRILYCSLQKRFARRNENDLPV